MDTNLIQTIRILKPPLAAIAVVGRVSCFLMFVESFSAAEDACAIVTRVLVLALLVGQPLVFSVRWPSSIAPTAFDHVRVVRAVVKMIAEAVRTEHTTTAFGHVGIVLRSLLLLLLLLERSSLRSVCFYYHLKLRHAEGVLLRQTPAKPLERDC